MRPRDLDRLRTSGTVAPALRPVLALAEEEAAELFEALGGLERVSPQQRLLVEDLAAVGIALRGTLATYVQGADPELASRIATLAGARRATLALLGLSRFEREIDLQTYLEHRQRQTAQNAPGATIAPEPQPAPQAVADEGAAGQGDALGRCPRCSAPLRADGGQLVCTGGHVLPDGNTSTGAEDRAGSAAPGPPHRS